MLSIPCVYAPIPFEEISQQSESPKTEQTRAPVQKSFLKSYGAYLATALGLIAAGAAFYFNDQAHLSALKSTHKPIQLPPKSSTESTPVPSRSSQPQTRHKAAQEYKKFSAAQAFEAIDQNDLGRLKKVLETTDAYPHAHDENHNTLLMHALVKQYEDKNNHNPHYSRLAIVRYLVKNFMNYNNINNKNDDGNTALMLTAEHADWLSMNLILEQDPERALKNLNGQTAFDLIPTHIFPERNTMRQLLKPKLHHPNK